MMCGARSLPCDAHAPTMCSPTSARCSARASTALPIVRESTRRYRRSTVFPTSPTDMRHLYAVGLTLGAVSACDKNSPSVTLTFHPPVGAVYHYGLEQRTQISIGSGPLAGLGTGKQRMTMHMFFTQTVKGSTSDAGTEVEVLFENLTMEIPGVPTDRLAGELSKMNGMRST